MVWDPVKSEWVSSKATNTRTATSEKWEELKKLNEKRQGRGNMVSITALSSFMHSEQEARTVGNMVLDPKTMTWMPKDGTDFDPLKDCGWSVDQMHQDTPDSWKSLRKEFEVTDNLYKGWKEAEKNHELLGSWISLDCKFNNSFQEMKQLAIKKIIYDANTLTHQQHPQHVNSQSPSITPTGGTKISKQKSTKKTSTLNYDDPQLKQYVEKSDDDDFFDKDDDFDDDDENDGRELKLKLNNNKLNDKLSQFADSEGDEDIDDIEVDDKQKVKLTPKIVLTQPKLNNIKSSDKSSANKDDDFDDDFDDDDDDDGFGNFQPKPLTFKLPNNQISTEIADDDDDDDDMDFFTPRQNQQDTTTPVTKINTSNNVSNKSGADLSKWVDDEDEEDFED
eukprot:TRINITY_DN709_c3_g1_i3.p1 TRINITY_DN709_c3_g1~~TRINITY_DN709_c3_g1_i3.p1  ORF type:complete len:392 (-),score=136.68 TRINITY_DN709_c3_g1_i3:134-1309(-)